jgi:hypothetical protein
MKNRAKRNPFTDPLPVLRILIFTHPESRIPELGSKNIKKKEG